MLTAAKASLMYLAAKDACTNPQPVGNFNANRYFGAWYQAYQVDEVNFVQARGS